MLMKIVTTAELVEREKEVIAAGTPAADLMERAGRGMAEIIQQEFPQAPQTLIVVGKGNNGGDGLVVARYLAAAGWTVRVVLAEGDKQLRDLPREQWKRLITEHPDVLAHAQLHDTLFPDARGLVIDALLGVGGNGPIRPPIAALVDRLNRARAQRFFRTVALDLPTGLPGDPEHALIADLTITVGAVKDFLVREEYSGRVGRIETVSLFEDTFPVRDRLLIARTLAPLLPRRSAYSHKNTYGRALIVGGSAGFIGAPILAAQAALRTGAGLTNLAVPKTIYPFVISKAPPEIMVAERAPNDDFLDLIESAKSIAVGPGLGLTTEAKRILEFILKKATAPLVLDADALTLLAAKPALFKTAKVPLVLTPHPGEMKRLLGREFAVEERPIVARELSDKLKAVVVLKGTRTLIAAPGEPLAYNSTGNPGLAVGGSGDTLTGILTALLAQGLKPYDAARVAVWLHGCAADFALRVRGCEEGLLPTDVSENLSRAITALRG